MPRSNNSIIEKNSYKRNTKTVAVRLLCLFFFVFQSQAQQLPEYKIKAIFLFNFTHFIEWPPSAFKNDNDPFVIGILDNDPFGHYIDEAITGEKIGNHSLSVVRYHNISEIANCQMLYIGEDAENIPAVLTGVSRRSILTVSDAQNFTKSGGMIGFTIVNEKIKLLINPDAVKAAGLNISSKLLSVAEISK